MRGISISSFTGSFGALVVAPGRARFRLWAPSARKVDVEFETGRSFAMRPLDDGWYEATVPCVAGTRYKYRIDDELRVADPASRLQAHDVHGYSVVVDPAAYVWRNTAWCGRPWHETVIYELHAGAMGGYRGTLARIEELAEMGITAIELMPIADFPGQHNWGYDGVLTYAPETTYGSPEELKALIDAAHGRGVQVFLDVVYNHFGPDGNYLYAYAGNFFDEALKNNWGSSINYQHPAVRSFFIENAIYWLEEYRFDGLRFDAVHAIPDASFVAELGERIRQHFAGDRHIHLILENDSNQAHFLDAHFDAQWNDDLHHVLHVLLTGETRGYYSAYADNTVARLARCLKEGFAYQGEPSPIHKGEPRGEPSAHLPPTAFISFLQNHDQIGNRACGDRLTTLADPQALRAAAALLLLAPQVPMLFMGEEWGSTKPFYYFVNHQGELAEAIREGRINEFALAAGPGDDKSVIPDPCDVMTYRGSILDHPASFEPAEDLQDDFIEWMQFYRDGLAVRHARIIPLLNDVRAIDARVLGEKAVGASWRLANGKTLHLYCNLAEEEAVLAPGEVPAGELILQTSAEAHGLLQQGRLIGHTTVALIA